MIGEDWVVISICPSFTRSFALTIPDSSFAVYILAYMCFPYLRCCNMGIDRVCAMCKATEQSRL